jgi:hypothetical protein
VTQSSTDGAHHIVASRDRDGSYAFVYFPTNDLTATVDFARLRCARLNGWWYDTRSGFAHPLGLIDGGANRDFKSPAHGPDWVLVLDDAAAGYAPPGLTRLPQFGARERIFRGGFRMASL